MKTAGRNEEGQEEEGWREERESNGMIKKTINSCFILTAYVIHA
jgi:hypothetical protein